MIATLVTRDSTGKKVWIQSEGEELEKLIKNTLESKIKVIR